MPRDGLTFAVKVSREINGFGLLCFPDDRPDVFFAALVQFVGHGEIVLRVNGPVFRWKVTHVAIGSQHLEICSKVAIDGGRLGRRFDNQQIDERALVVFIVFY